MRARRLNIDEATELVGEHGVARPFSYENGWSTIFIEFNGYLLYWFRSEDLCRDYTAAYLRAKKDLERAIREGS